jgi:hypothetical protein
MSVWTPLAKTLGRVVVATSLVGLALAACATPGGAPSTSMATPAPATSQNEDQILRERVATFWAARMTGDPKTQWELLEPRGKGRVTIQEYASDRGAVRYVAYQVEDATITGYFALVKVRLMFQPILPSPRRIGVQTILAEDRWVRIRGVWYRQLEGDGQGPAQEGQS